MCHDRYLSPTTQYDWGGHGTLQTQLSPTLRRESSPFWPLHSFRLVGWYPPWTQIWIRSVTQSYWSLILDLDKPNMCKFMIPWLFRFLDYLAELPDVYIVSIPRALAWIKAPVGLDAINSFEPWQVVEKSDNCPIKNNCRFAPEDTPGFPSERYMNICGSCPNKYPWLGDPLGESIRANKFDRK